MSSYVIRLNVFSDAEVFVDECRGFSAHVLAIIILFIASVAGRLTGDVFAIPNDFATKLKICFACRFDLCRIYILCRQNSLWVHLFEVSSTRKNVVCVFNCFIFTVNKNHIRSYVLQNDYIWFKTHSMHLFIILITNIRFWLIDSWGYLGGMLIDYRDHMRHV